MISNESILCMRLSEESDCVPPALAVWDSVKAVSGRQHDLVVRPPRCLVEWLFLCALSKAKQKGGVRSAGGAVVSGWVSDAAVKNREDAPRVPCPGGSNRLERVMPYTQVGSRMGNTRFFKSSRGEANHAGWHWLSERATLPPGRGERCVGVACFGLCRYLSREACKYPDRRAAYNV